MLGCSITYPHKHAAFAEADDITDRARRLGALNTLRRDKGGRLSGDATDGAALVHALTKAEVKVSGGKAHIIGAGGGAGRAIVDALCEAGIASLTVNDSNQTRLDETISLVKNSWADVMISAQGGAEILVDATANGRSRHNSPLFTSEAISASSVVCDIAGTRDVSQFVKLAIASGKPTIDATDMGLGQVEAQLGFVLGLIAGGK